MHVHIDPRWKKKVTIYSWENLALQLLHYSCILVYRIIQRRGGGMRLAGKEASLLRKGFVGTGENPF